MAARAAVADLAAQLWQATADPDGRGLLLRGREFSPRAAADFDLSVVQRVLRLARLADDVAQALRECPDAGGRRSAAVLGARAHPLLAAWS